MKYTNLKKQNMKIISKKYWQETKNFVVQNSTIKMNFVQSLL